MKTFSRLATTALAGAMIAGGASFALASPAAVSATGSASVVIVSPITISETQQMDFGTITQPSGADATATVSTAGALSVSGGGSTDTGLGTPQEGQFSVAAEDGNTVTIWVSNFSTPDNGVYFNDNFTADYNGSGSTALPSTSGTYTVSGVGAGTTLKVGGEITVPNGTHGTSNLSYDVNVDYQ